MGRPPLDPESRRSVRLSIRTTAAAKSHFVEAAKKRGYNPSSALREAITDWLSKEQK